MKKKKSGKTILALSALGTYLVFTRTGKGRAVIESIDDEVEAILERDPAASGRLEALTCYAGLHASLLHRAAHALYEKQIPFIPRLISQFSRFVTGIEIHPGARIGKGLFIDHGSGVVIGETTEIGDNVTLYQGVTLGGTGKEKGKRHPTVGDNVVVGAGAKVLGGIEIGQSAKIGAGAIVIHPVPADSTVVGNPGRPVLQGGQKIGIPDIDYTQLPDPIAEAMTCLIHRILSLEEKIGRIEAGKKTSVKKPAEKKSAPKKASK